MTQFNFEDNYIMKVIKVGRKLYTGWHQGYPKYKYPVSILISDVEGEFNVGDFIIIPKDKFYLESLAYTNSMADSPHRHRYTRDGFITQIGGVLVKKNSKEGKSAMRNKGASRK